MSYIPFPIDEILVGLVELVRANRTAFSPNVETADLDEFWGVGKDMSTLPDVFVIVRPDEGEFAFGGIKVSEDLVKAAVIIYSRLDLANSRDGSTLMLRQLVQVLRSAPGLDSLSALVTNDCEIKWVRPVGYAPDNQFSSENFAGWSVTVEVGVTCRATKAALPTYP